MAETGRLVAFYGAGEPMRIEEYPVPEPEPGAIVVRTTLANVCGSDLHVWRGDQDLKKMGRALPRHPHASDGLGRRSRPLELPT